jgi:hypothetical protein
MENQKYMRDAAECALKFLDDYSLRNNSLEWFGDKNVYAYKMFRALAELTISDLDANKSPDKCKYKPTDIGKKSKISEDTKFVNRHLNNLINKYIQRHDFKEIAEKYQLSAIPTVVKDGSKGGSQNEYFIVPVTIDNVINKNTENLEQDETSEYINDCSEPEIKSENIGDSIEQESKKDEIKNDYIEYSVEYITVNKAMNWIYNHELSNKVINIDATIIFILMAMSFFFGFYSIPVFFYAEYSSIYFFMIQVYGVLMFFFRPEFDCIQKRTISIIPFPSIPEDIHETQLECIATDKPNPKTGNLIRRIQLVSYWATCPICKEELGGNVRIELKKGGKEFPNRLIGCCSESPAEHIYSFDRITRIGKHLRK